MNSCIIGTDSDNLVIEFKNKMRRTSHMCAAHLQIVQPVADWVAQNLENVSEKLAI